MRMRVRIVGFALIALAATQSELSAQDVERLFYYVDNEDAYESLVANIDRVSVIAPAAYSVDADGIVWGEVDPRVLELAREKDLPVMPLIVNPGFDQEMLSELLGNPEARARAVHWMLEECRRQGYWGIQFDFENVSIDDRDRLTEFYRETAAALHAEGFKLSIAVVHRPADFPGPTRYHKWLFRNWRAGYDLAALGEIGDFISLMSYAQHTRRTPPGPQASVVWQEEVIEYFLRFVPAEKLSLGIPTGSQHWYTSQEDRITPELARSYSENIPWKRAMGLVERYGAELEWSDAHQVSYAFFPRGGTFEWIFLENARSFNAKLELVRTHRLRGFSVWVLGTEDPGIWQSLPALTP